MKLHYGGKHPHLCGGTLVITLEDGRVFEGNNFIKSGGDFHTNPDGEELVTSGPWKVNKERLISAGFPEERVDELIKLVNDQLPHGCCGGCI